MAGFEPTISPPPGARSRFRPDTTQNFDGHLNSFNFPAYLEYE